MTRLANWPPRPKRNASPEWFVRLLVVVLALGGLILATLDVQPEADASVPKKTTITGWQTYTFGAAETDVLQQHPNLAPVFYLTYPVLLGPHVPNTRWYQTGVWAPDTLHSPGKFAA